MLWSGAHVNPKPTIDRSLLHPESNKAVAMDAEGKWLSYSGVPVADDAGWLKPSVDTVCFRIPASRAPDWQGDWRQSLVVFEDAESSNWRSTLPQQPARKFGWGRTKTLSAT